MSGRRLRRWSGAVREKGLTLLEVMAAVTILALATSALLITINKDFDNSVESHNLRLAKMLAVKKMEEVLLFYTSESTTSTLDSSGTFESDGYPQFEWVVEDEEMNLTTDDEKKDGKEDQILYKITLTVRYKKGDGSDAEYKLSSIVEPPKRQ